MERWKLFMIGFNQFRKGWQDEELQVNTPSDLYCKRLSVVLSNFCYIPEESHVSDVQHGTTIGCTSCVLHIVSRQDFWGLKGWARRNVEGMLRAGEDTGMLWVGLVQSSGQNTGEWDRKRCLKLWGQWASSRLQLFRLFWESDRCAVISPYILYSSFTFKLYIICTLGHHGGWKTVLGAMLGLQYCALKKVGMFEKLKRVWVLKLICCKHSMLFICRLRIDFQSLRS